ncbi:MAG: hypothetical protein ACRD2F_04085 [Terriglobales bacterium]
MRTPPQCGHGAMLRHGAAPICKLAAPRSGVGGVFPPGSSLEAIIAFIRDHVRPVPAPR